MNLVNSGVIVVVVGLFSGFVALALKTLEFRRRLYHVRDNFIEFKLAMEYGLKALHRPCRRRLKKALAHEMR